MESDILSPLCFTTHRGEKPLAQWVALMLLPAAAMALFGCVHAHVDPVEIDVKPITININIKYVDESLDNFFDFQKKYDAATQPTTIPVQ